MGVKEKPGSLTKIPAKAKKIRLVTAGDHAWCVSMFTPHLLCASMEDLWADPR